jgi:hypothetical protein
MKNVLAYCVVIATMVISPLSAIAQERAEAPTHKDGDTWIFKLLDKGFELSADRNVNVTVSYSRGRFIVEPRTLGVRRMLAIDDEAQFLQFPIFVGKTWWMNRADGPVRWIVTMSVTGVEDVTTAAGNFRSFIIKRREAGIRFGGDAGRGEGRSAGRLYFTYYYSPQTQSIVKHYFTNGIGGRGGTREIELVEVRAAH